MLERALLPIGLARLLRIGVVGSIPATWFEIAVLHFRGSFHSRPMWLPVLGLPVLAAAGAVIALEPDEDRSRARFLPLALALTGIGTIGTAFHVRGVLRQMGGLPNWRYNVVTGPPFPAALQVALVGSAGVLAALPRARRLLGDPEDAGLVRAIRGLNVASYVLLALEAGWEHWKGSYFNPVMYTPVAVSPVMVAVHAGADARLRPARRVEGPLSLAATLAGFVGFAFHLRNVSRRRGGWSWQNLFYAAPTVAPLQLSAQGVLGVLAALFDPRR